MARDWSPLALISDIFIVTVGLALICVFCYGFIPCCYKCTVKMTKDMMESNETRKSAKMEKRRVRRERSKDPLVADRKVPQPINNSVRIHEDERLDKLSNESDSLYFSDGTDYNPITVQSV